MLLTLSNVTKSYATSEGPIRMLDNIDLDLDAGQSLALTGESGSGKSTLLHLVAGLDTADEGRVIVAGKDIAGASDSQRAALRRGTVGLVFQQFNLIPSLTVGAPTLWVASSVALSCGSDDDIDAASSKSLGSSSPWKKP